MQNREPMTEHEEYKNADVPVDIWIQRNEYLHKHIDKLNEEINQLRKQYALNFLRYIPNDCSQNKKTKKTKK